MRYIYFSPHLDDTILSAGGLISDQTKAGIQVEIWTFMSGVPDEERLTDFAQLMHKTWGMTTARQTIQIRREEDRQATSRVGAKAVHGLVASVGLALQLLYRLSVRGAAISCA